jgi:hypothetical protein
VQPLLEADDAVDDVVAVLVVPGIAMPGGSQPPL